jgi:hypothetical protein
MPKFVKRHSQNSLPISGFWGRNQGETLTGKLCKFVPNEKKGAKNAKPFFIIEVADAIATLNTEDGDFRPIAKGDFVGVSANWSLKSQLDIEADIGKIVRLTVNGEAPNPNGGNPMILFDVEVAEPEKGEAPTESDEDLPF